MGGLIAAVLGVVFWFALRDVIALPTRTVVASAIVLAGAIWFWRHRHGGLRCPRCGSRYSNVVEEYYRTILFVCDSCRVCWDTGREHLPDTTGS